MPTLAATLSSSSSGNTTRPSSSIWRFARRSIVAFIFNIATDKHACWPFRAINSALLVQQTRQVSWFQELLSVHCATPWQPILGLLLCPMMVSRQPVIVTRSCSGHPRGNTTDSLSSSSSSSSNHIDNHQTLSSYHIDNHQTLS
jgi:hypothetical protein